MRTNSITRFFECRQQSKASDLLFIRHHLDFQNINIVGVRIMLKTIRLVSLTTLFLLVFAGIGFSQETKGSIDGTVTDSSGAVIPNATVKVQGNSFNRTVQADSNGFYRILAVPPGVFSITASADGFSTGKPTTVTVRVGVATPVNFSLKAGGSTVQVDVQGGDIGVIDTTSSGVSESITAERAEQLPKGISFSTLLASTPSVRNESKGAGFSINGASGAENTFIIDGQEVTNFRTGQLQTNNDLPFSLVEEVQVKSGGFAAELGGATGGVISIVTKSGGNEFNGEIGTAFRVAQLDGNPRRALFGDSDTLTYLTSPKDDYTFFYPTVQFSGPIVKDRLWFFTNYDVQSEIINRKVDYANDPSEEYQLNTRRDYGIFKLTSQVTNDLSLEASYTYNPVRQHGRLDSTTPFATSPPSDGILTGRAFTDTQGGRRASAIYNFAGTWTATSNLVITSRYGESYLNEKLGSYGIPNLVRYRCRAAQFGGVNQCPPGDQNIPSNFGTNKDISKRRTFDVDASYIIDDLAGRHILKGGYQLNRISNDVDQGYVSTGEIRYWYGRNSFGFGVADGGIGYVYLQLFGTLGNTSSKSQSVFIQDSWTIGRLTINPGLRIEKEDVPSFSDVGIPLIFGWGDKPAPRIGFAYDVLGDGKWKISGGWGWFYDRFKYELPRGSFGGDTFRRFYHTILAGEVYPFYTREAAIAEGNEFDFRVPSNDPSDQRVDPDLKAARDTQFDVSTEFELRDNWVLGARYVHKQLDRAIEDVGIFDENGNELFFIVNPGFGLNDTAFFPGFNKPPKAERKYDAVEFKFIKRLSDNYFFNGSYTYSRLFGNYSGLASSDENGRSSPNVNRFFDEPHLGWDHQGNPDNGRLATDRPHVFKLNAGYSLDWMGSATNRTNFNMFFLGQSGSPISTRVSFLNTGTFLNSRGDLGRTDTFTQTDFSLNHTYKFGSDNRYSVVFNLDVLNLFDQKTVTNRFESIFGSDLSDADLNVILPGVGDSEDAIRAVFSGATGNAIRELNTRGDAGASTCGDGTETCSSYKTDARFNQPSAFQARRTVRFGFRFRF